MAAKKKKKKAKKAGRKGAKRASTAKRGAARHTLTAGMHKVKGKIPSAKTLAHHGLKVVGVKLAKRKGAKKKTKRGKKK